MEKVRIEITPELRRRLKTAAALKKTTMSKLAETLLTESLVNVKESKKHVSKPKR